ncbi:hypothetical protein J3A83DRAFT_4191290 [Scleroderma citrinum]
MWVEHIGNIHKLKHNELGAHTHHPIKPMVWDQHPPEDDTIEYRDSTLIMINVNDAKIEASTTLTYSQKSSYDVTIYDGSKVSNWAPLSLQNGCDIWVITGDKKGYLAQLVSLGHQSSIISMLSYPNFQIKNTDVMTSGVPPPSQPPSPVAEEQNLGKMDDDSWKISASDLTPAPADPLTLSTATAVQPQVNKDFHVCFNVRLHYNHGILVKQVIEHYMIPVECLTPAAPKGKGEKCLMLKGEKAGQIHVIKECRMKKWQVVLNNGTTLPFDNVCWVIGVHP